LFNFLSAIILKRKKTERAEEKRSQQCELEQGAGGAAQQGEPEASDAQGENVEDVDFEEVK
jgi:hypothetical protein